jgi:general secretion pathway protein A
MYREFFGLKEIPFSIAPDPRYLYMSEGHREALAHLVYGMRSDGGFVLLTGEVGTGKTTVCRCLLEQIPENTDIAFILNPKVTVGELLAGICDELGIRYPRDNTSVKVFVDSINEYLLDAHARGRRTVLIIEEAQNLSPDVLEQVRLLTNLETNQRKLLQIIMLGQPELQAKLAMPELRQLAQRITARYHLGPLPGHEMQAYVAHRLEVAGARGDIFPSSLVNRLYRLTGGIPRLVNTVCDRALLGAYVQGRDRVDRDTLICAAREVLGVRGLRNRTYLWAGAVVLLICAAVLSVLYFSPQQRETHVSGQMTEGKRLDTVWWFGDHALLWRMPKDSGRPVFPLKKTAQKRKRMISRKSPVVRMDGVPADEKTLSGGAAENGGHTTAAGSGTGSEKRQEER